MPIAPLRPCGHPGCPELVAKGRCTRHTVAVRQTYERTRGTAAQRGYDSNWVKARKTYLRQYPWCATHLKRGELIRAEHVDHKVPHRGDQKLFWDKTNWQSLCKSCHSSKTASEDGGFGNARR